VRSTTTVPAPILWLSHRFALAVTVAAMMLALMSCGDVLDAIDSGAEPIEDTETVDARSSDGDPGSDAGEAFELRRLSDGDSGIIAIGGEEIEFRLLGYNAPERFEGDDGPLSCNGEAAEAALRQVLTEAGPAASFVGAETDRFGRTLGDFVIDDRSVVEDLVAEGWGLATGDTARRDLMEAAAAESRGLWGSSCGTPAADGILVDRVEPDPPGRDEDDLNGETVELINAGDEAIDLAGWDIRDDSSSHRFDLGGTIEPGARLVIRTGSGDSGGGELFLGSRSPVWSNRGDTVLVIDPDGVVAAWAFVN